MLKRRVSMAARGQRASSLLWLAALSLGLTLAQGSAYAERRIVDMAGRTVIVPDRIQRIATIGPVPVLNGFLFAFKDGNLLVNGLPTNFARSPRWKFEWVFAPQMRILPIIQGAGNDPIAASVLDVRPDVVLTMLPGVVHAMEAIHVPVVYLAWDRPDEVKELMNLLGRLLNKPDVASDYSAYFDATLWKVDVVTRKLPESARPRVLYCDLVLLTQPHLIAEWWIQEAGGRSVTDNGRRAQSISFSLEQLLAWNPEILIVTDAKQTAKAYSDPRLASVDAIRNHRVYVAPSGAHLWTNRTVEEPLTVLWAAKTIHPELFRNLDVARQTSDFYTRFFGVTLQPRQVEEIIRGGTGGL